MHTRSISIPASHMQSPWNSDSLAVTTTLLFSSRNGHCYVLCRETRLLGPVTKLRNSWKYFQEPAPGINQCRPCKYLTQIHHASCASKVGTISHISFDPSSRKPAFLLRHHAAVAAYFYPQRRGIRIPVPMMTNIKKHPWRLPWVACWCYALSVPSLLVSYVPTHGTACSHSFTTTLARRQRRLCNPSWRRLLPRRPGWQHPWSGCISMTALSRSPFHLSCSILYIFLHRYNDTCWTWFLQCSTENYYFIVSLWLIVIG